jgi:hypothetical protein
VPLFSEFAKQVVAHNPDIAESGKPMEEKKFTEEKICYPAKIANLSVANCQSLHFDFTFEIIVGSWNRRPGPPSPNYSPTFV